MAQLQDHNRARRGYTLVETLVAMLMFALISAATTFALQAAIGGQRAAHRKADEIQEARTVLAIMSRDFRGAYASKANPNTFFVSSGSDTAPSISFTSLTHRLFAPLTDSSANPVDPTTIPPQSDVSVIHYSYDPSTAELGRIETSVPNPDLINQLDTLGSTGSPETTLSRRVRRLSIQFLDPTNGARSDWNFTTQPPTTPSATGTPAATPTDTQTGDAALPTAVQITIEFAAPGGGSSTYSTTVYVETPTPQPIGQKPAPPVTAGTPDSGGTPSRPSIGTPGGGGPRPGGGGGPSGGLPGLTITPRPGG